MKNEKQERKSADYNLKILENYNKHLRVIKLKKVIKLKPDKKGLFLLTDNRPAYFNI